MLKLKIRLGIVLVFLSLPFCFFILSKMKNNTAIDPHSFHGTLLNQPRDLKPFALTDTHNAPFNQSALTGQWTILFFGFTHCSSVCPTTMAELGKMYRLLEKDNISPKPHVVMITIDPKRDNIKTLSTYVKAFNPHFIGARGSSKATHALTQELGIAYIKVIRPSSTNNAYEDIEHTGALILINPKGKLVAFFTQPHDAAMLVEDYRLITHSK